MSLITTPVKFTVLPADGVPVAGLRVRAELTRADVDGGVLVPMPRARGDTDLAGQCTLNLWPNSRGVNASQYRVKVYQAQELIHSFFITVPESVGVVLAETIINQAPYPAVDAAQAAVTAAQAAAVEAQQAVIDAANASRLTIGTVSTLSPGASATASITGDAGEQVLNLGIPKGADGAGGGPGGAVTSVAGKTGDVTLAKGDVGLGNVDNTPDASKPVSTAQAAADTAVLNAAAADATAKANAAAAASDPAGAAASAVAAHAGATDPHGDRAFATAADAAILASANAHAESLVVGLVDDRGNFDASGNTFPASGGSGTAGAVLKGDLWTVSVAGTLGGKAVTAGDLVRALVDAPGQTAGNWAVTENNIGYVPANSADKDASGGFAGLTGFKLNLVNALGTITSWFTTAATAARTWTLPDKSGTVAMTSDIPATTDALTEGGTSLYHTAARVRATVLTGLSTAAGTVVAATHTVLEAIGFLQKQVSDNASAISGKAASGAIGSSGLTMATAKLLGRGTASTGAVEEITLGTNLSFSGTTLNATGGGSPGGSTTQLQYNSSGAFAGVTGSEVDANGRITLASSGSAGIFARWNTNQYIGIVAQPSGYTDKAGLFNLGFGPLFVYDTNTGDTVVNVSYPFGKLRLSTKSDGTVYIDSGTAGTYRDLKLRNLIASGGVVQHASFTVSTLPSASTSGAGAQAFVTDANATTPRSTVAGGGSNKVNVFSDGTNWLIAA